MTRRLIALDLSAAEYFAIKDALNDRVDKLDEENRLRDRNTAARANAKFSDAWEARGHEGRGYNTRTPRRER